MKIKAGSIFITKNGNPIDRSNLAKELKKLAEAAKVAKEKVFPHNFRHLFARVFYSKYKDIVRLADILGHSSINTITTHRKNIFRKISVNNVLEASKYAVKAGIVNPSDYYI